MRPARRARPARSFGSGSTPLGARVEERAARQEAQLDVLFQRWDRLVDAEAPPDVRRATLESLRSLLQERSYIANLIAATDRERGEL